MSPDGNRVLVLLVRHAQLAVIARLFKSWVICREEDIVSELASCKLNRKLDALEGARAYTRYMRQVFPEPMLPQMMNPISCIDCLLHGGVGSAILLWLAVLGL
jgi:hypothetical protein